MHDTLVSFTVLFVVVILLIVLLRKLGQPDQVAYILAGLVLGPSVTGIFSDATHILEMGEIGIFLLMFFLGLEIEIPDNKSLLRKPLIAQLSRFVLGLLFALLIGQAFGWNLPQQLLLFVVLSFNSTAVVTEYLRGTNALHNSNGRMLLNMLLIQDIAVAPVLSLFQFYNDGGADFQLIPAAIAGVLIFLLLRTIRNQHLYQWPAIKNLEQDHELQVFVSALICVGFSCLASLAGLSASIGSFIAGVYIGRLNAFHWVGAVLRPFKIFFLALFFVSVGLQLELDFIAENYVVIAAVSVVVIVSNSLLSAFVFRLMKLGWGDSLRNGVLLSQTGEFGLLATTIARNGGLISEEIFRVLVAVTGITLIVSTVLARLMDRGKMGY
ncbi:MAG: cation:proton antiporter [Chitinophagaceae bacterium]|nr:MAG: cation:proton antiporter [Chitinophagaceae bacterium]